MRGTHLFGYSAFFSFRQTAVTIMKGVLMRKDFIHDEWCASSAYMEGRDCNCYVRTIKDYYKLGLLLGVMLGVILTLILQAIV
jgi:hypothetical protein